MYIFILEILKASYTCSYISRYILYIQYKSMSNVKQVSNKKKILEKMVAVKGNVLKNNKTT